MISLSTSESVMECREEIPLATAVLYFPFIELTPEEDLGVKS